MSNEILFIIFYPVLVVFLLLPLFDILRMWNEILKHKHALKYHIFPGDHYWDDDVSIFEIWAEHRAMMKAMTNPENLIIAECTTCWRLLKASEDCGHDTINYFDGRELE